MTAAARTAEELRAFHENLDARDAASRAFHRDHWAGNPDLCFCGRPKPCQALADELAGNQRLRDGLAAEVPYEASEPDAVALLQGWLDGRLVLSEAAVRAVLAENARMREELEQLRAERDEEAPVMPDPRGPEHQRVVTDWHTVSATSHKSCSPDGEEWDLEYDIEHPDECNLLPYGRECLFDYVATLFGLDEGELGFGPREARAHVYGPDMNGDFEEWIEWGRDADTAPQPAQSEGASDA